MLSTSQTTPPSAATAWMLSIYMGNSLFEVIGRMRFVFNWSLKTHRKSILEDTPFPVTLGAQLYHYLGCSSKAQKKIIAP